jgi:uncharacterized protein
LSRDEDKSRLNHEKHGIRFEEATSVFLDPLLLTFFDEEHSVDESRFIGIGRSARGRILRVVFMERMDKIRLISCRKANAAQRRLYETNEN